MSLTSELDQTLNSSYVGPLGPTHGARGGTPVGPGPAARSWPVWPFVARFGPFFLAVRGRFGLFRGRSWPFSPCPWFDRLGRFHPRLRARLGPFAPHDTRIQPVLGRYRPVLSRDRLLKPDAILSYTWVSFPHAVRHVHHARAPWYLFLAVHQTNRTTTYAY